MLIYCENIKFEGWAVKGREMAGPVTIKTGI